MAVNTAPTLMVGYGILRIPLDSGRDVALQPDGKILVAGSLKGPSDRPPDFGLVRYNADGTFDTSFDSDGVVTTNFGILDDTTFFQSTDDGYSIALQSDGKILVAGSSNNDFALARYNTNGSLDTTFSGDGKLTTAFGASSRDQGYSVVVQSDGKILVAGESRGSTLDFALARYNADGSLDSSFSGDGKLTTDFGGQDDSAFGVTLQSDGKILLAGRSSTTTNNVAGDFALARYNADGSLDSSFSGDGKLTTDFAASNDTGASIIVQPDGKILVAGTASFSNFGLARYNADGSLDGTFGTAGKVTTPQGLGASVTLQSDGKILVAGDTGRDFVLARYNVDGSLDSTFDGDGKVITDLDPFDQPTDTARSITVQPDGRILVAGTTNPGGVTYAVLARYNSDGSLDLRFDAENTLAGARHYSENGVGVVLAPDAGIYDAELHAQGNYAGASITLARHGGANPEDVFVWYDASSPAVGHISALTQGAALVYSGVTVGTVTTNLNGTLVLTFNANATQSRVDGVLRSIAYSNASEAPPDSVRIDWSFSDGNSGAQGSGGALSSAGSTPVHISHVNDAPTFSGGPNEVLANATARTVPHWATDISPGPADEAGQPLHFQVSVSYPALFSKAPAISVDGTLTYEIAAGATGTSIVKVILFDHSIVGSTPSVPYEFIIRVAAGSLLDGDSNRDNIIGGPANETLAGREGNDSLHGGDGNDSLYGGAGADALDGGDGFDLARYDTAPAAVTADLTGSVPGTGEAAGDTFTQVEGIVGSAFNDRLFGDALANTLQGRDGIDSLYGKGGADTLQGGAGNDNLYGDAGADNLDGGADFDYARYDTASAGVRADLSGVTAGIGDAAGDTFHSIEGLVGSAFDDTFYGDALANALQGRDGIDRLYGRDGNDTLEGGSDIDSMYGGAGQDTLLGGDGNDNLYGEAGADALDGGADLDYARYDAAPAAVWADLSNLSAGVGDALGDTFTQIEGLVGSAFDDRLTGDALANILQGRDGNDILAGKAGNDTLRGGDGDDGLDGGTGADTLDGGAGNDTFRFTKGEANGDRVQDFNGNGPLAGDQLVFQGYGLGAAFIQTSLTTGEIHYGITSVETLTFVAPTLVGLDYSFV